MFSVMSSRRVHVPAGTFLSGRRFRAACSCGWVSTPRVDERRAVEALETEHGYEDAICALCGRSRDDMGLPWADRYRHVEVLTDPASGDQFLACSDDQEECRTLSAQASQKLTEVRRPVLRVIQGGSAGRSSE